MDSQFAPQIRLEIEAMKASIMHHMGLHGSELGEHIDREVMKAIESYPWEERVRKIAHNAIDEAVERYFKYGGGAYRAIHDAIDKAVEGLE